MIGLNGDGRTGPQLPIGRNYRHAAQPGQAYFRELPAGFQTSHDRGSTIGDARAAA